jgi:hypothetical protein
MDGQMISIKIIAHEKYQTSLKGFLIGKVDTRFQHRKLSALFQMNRKKESGKRKKIEC